MYFDEPRSFNLQTLTNVSAFGRSPPVFVVLVCCILAQKTIFVILPLVIPAKPFDFEEMRARLCPGSRL
jgi:hypothetical protein